MVPELVISRAGYKRAWNEKDVFGTTMAPQIHYLRHYTVLFVGFSFQDEYVCRLLRRLKHDCGNSGTSSHYAFLPNDGVSDCNLAQLGVRAVRWHDPEDLANKIARIYQAGLVADGGEELRLPEVRPGDHIPTGRVYRYPVERVWGILSACRNEGIPTLQASHKPISGNVGEIGVSRFRRHGYSAP